MGMQQLKCIFIEQGDINIRAFCKIAQIVLHEIKSLKE
jgi:hypothetical protein